MTKRLLTSTRAQRYVDGALSGAIDVPVFIKRSCERWKAMRKTHTYDKRAVDYIGATIETMPCPEGVIAKFNLFDWQCYLLSWLVGFKDDNGARAVQECLVVVPRKAGKSSLLAAFALASCAEPAGGVRAPLTLMCGVNDDTAKITYEKAQKIIDADKASKGGMKFSKAYGFSSFTKEIRCKKTGGTIEPKTFGAKSLEGFTPELVIVDEISRLPNMNGIETIRTGFGAAFSPQLLMTTTPSDLPFSAYDVELRHAMRWLGMEVDGSDSDDAALDDPNYLALIFAATTDDDPGDEDVWQRTQPSYHDIAGMKREYTKGWRAAQADVIKMHAFKTRQLCVPARLSGAWITVEDWNATPVPPAKPQLENGWATYIGIDLSDVRDLSALAILQVCLDENINEQRLWFECFVPRSALPTSAEDKADTTNQMVQWIDDGWITVHESETIDHALIAQRLDELMMTLRPVVITSDQFNAIDDVRRFAKPHTDRMIRPYQKSLTRFTPPIAQLTNWVANKTIAIQKNPVAEQHLKNAVLEQGKHGGYILTKPTQSSVDKIDVIDATLTAIGGWLQVFDEKKAGSDDAPIIKAFEIKPRVL